MTTTRATVVQAAIKRADGVWWRPLAYCDTCGKRTGLTHTPGWCRVRIQLPEFRRNATCEACRLALLAQTAPVSLQAIAGWTRLLRAVGTTWD